MVPAEGVTKLTVAPPLVILAPLASLNCTVMVVVPFDCTTGGFAVTVDVAAEGVCPNTDITWKISRQTKAVDRKIRPGRAIDQPYLDSSLFPINTETGVILLLI
jgi:hypothetical protein